MRLRVRSLPLLSGLTIRRCRELVLAVAVFRSVFHCGDVEVLRADRFAGRDGLYLTYEASCPLVSGCRGQEYQRGFFVGQGVKKAR